MVSRRRFLRASTLAASVGVAGTGTAPLASAAPRRSSPSPAARLGTGAPRRIIHVVADGTSQGTLSCADQLSLTERGRPLAWTRLLGHPEARLAWMDMRSLDSLVTDSAAAASSWGSGTRVRNGVLNTSSTGKALVPLAELVGQAGWKRGLVTTTEITHATPAGFAVSVSDRGSGEDIAAQYLGRRIEVLLGGARAHFDPAKRKDKRDLPAEFAAAGYHVARTASDLDRAPDDQPWLGLFADGHLPYTIDHLASRRLRREVPTLARMVERALDRLEREDRFLLQIEGGRVDHACHNNDAAAALRDLVALDDALEHVLRFRDRHPETLVVVTTDHGNANLGLNGMGSSYRDSSLRFRYLADIHASFPEIIKRLKSAPSEADAAAILAETTGYRPDTDKVARLLPFLRGKGSSLYEQMNSDVAALGQLLANYLGIGFTGTTHTSDYVGIVAIGPGSEAFRGLIRNTDIFHHYVALAGIDFRNPEEPLLAHATPPVATEDCDAYRRPWLA